MFPIINLRETGINLRRIMDKRGIEPKDVQEYLNLASAQSVYNWCNGINMPTIKNILIPLWDILFSREILDRCVYTLGIKMC